MRTTTHTLADLIDLARLQRTCDSFAAIGDIGLAVLDPGGTVLVSAGWQDICRDFHRIHKETLEGCRESDRQIDRRLVDGLHGQGAPEHYAYRCANGLWDVAFPLVVAGEHLGNVFTGQFFYDDDEIDVAAFRARAERLGFDEAAYLEALARVPVLSHERVAQTIGFLAGFVGMLGELGLSALRTEEESAALRESEERLEEAQIIARLGRWELNLVSGALYWSKSIFALFEIDPSGFGASYEAFLDAVHPDDRDAVDRAYRASLEDKHPYEIAHRLLMKDGRVKRVREACRTDFDEQGRPLRSIGVVQDVTEHMQAEEVQAFLARTSSGTQDEPFFAALARYLAHNLGMDFVCIDRLEGDGLTARTVAVWCDGQFEDNVTYALADTPCGDVVGKAVCCFPASVCRYFPRDQVLQDLRAESYVGVTLWSHTRTPIGLIAVISRSPLANRRLAEATLEMVGARAAGELERLDAEAALRAEKERYRILTEGMKDVVWTLDTDTLRFLYVSPSVEKLRGFTPNEIIAEPMDAALTAEAAEHFKDLIRQRAGELLAGNASPERFYTDEVEQPCKDGTTVWTEVITSYCFSETTGRVELRGVTRDITLRKQAEEKLAHLNDELAAEAAALAEANATITRIAATDDLTGLANRRCFYEALEKAVSLARRHGSPVVLVSFDLDGLKRVNDEAGHAVGDEVLASFAALLRTLCRAEDLPARLGGDEFSLLLPGDDLVGGRGLAERVLAEVRSRKALAQRGVTVSGGVAQWVPGELPDDLLRRADQALYAAKRSGRDTVIADA